MSTTPLSPIKADVSFVKPIQEYALLNSGAEDIEFTYNGETVTVPARDKIVSDGRHQSVTDTEGNLIPGSVIIRDIPNYRVRHWPDDGGGMRPEVEHWDAKEAIIHGLKINDVDGTLSDFKAHRGISPLPANPTPAQVATIDAAGRKRAELWEEHKALTIWASYQGKVDKEQRSGMPPTSPNEEELEAKARIDVLSKKRTAAMAKKYGFRVTDGDQWTPTYERGRAVDSNDPAPPPTADITDEDQAEALVRALANPKARKILDEYFTTQKTGTLKKRRTPKSKQPSRKRDPKTKNSAAIQVPED